MQTRPLLIVRDARLDLVPTTRVGGPTHEPDHASQGAVIVAKRPRLRVWTPVSRHGRHSVERRLRLRGGITLLSNATSGPRSRLGTGLDIYLEALDAVGHLMKGTHRRYTLGCSPGRMAQKN